MATTTQPGEGLGKVKALRKDLQERKEKLEAKGFVFEFDDEKSHWSAKNPKLDDGILDVKVSLADLLSNMETKWSVISAKADNGFNWDFPLIQQLSISDFAGRHKITGIYVTEDGTAEIEYANKSENVLTAAFITPMGTEHAKRRKEFGATLPESLLGFEEYCEKFPYYAPKSEAAAEVSAVSETAEEIAVKLAIKHYFFESETQHALSLSKTEGVSYLKKAAADQRGGACTEYRYQTRGNNIDVWGAQSHFDREPDLTISIHKLAVLVLEKARADQSEQIEDVSTEAPTEAADNLPEVTDIENTEMADYEERGWTFETQKDGTTAENTINDKKITCGPERYLSDLFKEIDEFDPDTEPEESASAAETVKTEKSTLYFPEKFVIKIDLKNKKFLIPPEDRFEKSDFLKAPEIETVGKYLIEEYPDDFDHLSNANILYLWKRAGGATGGADTLGKCVKPSGLAKHFAQEHGDDSSEKVDYFVWLAADNLRMRAVTAKTIYAIVFHELLHTQKIEGKFTLRSHEFEGFAREIEEFGFWKNTIKNIANACDEVRHTQLGLFE